MSPFPRENPQKSVILIGIGFETTAPTIAASILEAESQGIENYYVLCLNKLTPPVIKSLLNFKEVLLDGIVCPGHVSSIIGSHPYESIASDYGIACVVSGFEPLDILLCVDMLVGQIEDGEARVEIAYRRGVRPEGNKQAMKLMRRVFEVCPATWRGMGNLPESGLRLRREYQRFDVEQVFEIDLEDSFEPKGCLCGEILRGVKVPPDCKLFSRKCTLEHPVGPCMASSEGSCSIYYRYVR